MSRSSKCFGMYMVPWCLEADVLRFRRGAHHRAGRRWPQAEVSLQAADGANTAAAHDQECDRQAQRGASFPRRQPRLLLSAAGGLFRPPL